MTAVPEPSDPPETPVEISPAADALTVLSRTVVIGCLSVAVLATGWVGLELIGGRADGWEQMIALLGLSVAGLALLAVIPHALVLRWVRRHRRSDASPWSTLVAVLFTAAPIPATMLYFAEHMTVRLIVLPAILTGLVAVEVALMLLLWGRPTSGHPRTRRPRMPS